MSRNTKIILGIVGALLLLCVCAGIGGVLALRQLGGTVASSFNEEPTEVEATARSISDFALPSGYEGQFGMSFFGIKMAALGPEAMADGPIFLLMQFPESLGGLSQEEMEQQMRDSMEQQFQNNSMELETVGTQAATIRGQETTLTIREGRDEDGNEMRQLLGVFPGKGGQAMLMVMGEVAEWDQDMVDAFIASME